MWLCCDRCSRRYWWHVCILNHVLTVKAACDLRWRPASCLVTYTNKRIISFFYVCKKSFFVSIKNDSFHNLSKPEQKQCKFRKPSWKKRTAGLLFCFNPRLPSSTVLSVAGIFWHHRRRTWGWQDCDWAFRRGCASNCEELCFSRFWRGSFCKYKKATEKQRL